MWSLSLERMVTVFLRPAYQGRLKGMLVNLVKNPEPSCRQNTKFISSVSKPKDPYLTPLLFYLANTAFDPSQKQVQDVDSSVHVPVPQYTTTLCVSTQSYTVALRS
jgi:hypothetical protein